MASSSSTPWCLLTYLLTFIETPPRPSPWCTRTPPHHHPPNDNNKLTRPRAARTDAPRRPPVQVHENIYGTSIAAVKAIADQGKTCLLDIDVQAKPPPRTHLTPSRTFSRLLTPARHRRAGRPEGIR